jgi:ABC-2 type transport system permease protein
MSAITRYAAVFRFSMTLARYERAELYARMAFFAIILGVFSSLWRAVAEAGMPLAADPRTLVWYLAVTEWILLSAPQIHIEMQEAIRRGDVVYRLGLPVSYALAEFASGLGLLAARAPVLGVTAFVCAFVFTRWIPSGLALLLVVPFGLIAAALITALYLAIGLLAFWLQDVSPIFWVWQKLLFVLGGLMLPLEIYPAFVRQAARFTPFPVVLAEPASFVLGSHVEPRVLLFQLVLWFGIIAILASWMFRRAASALSVNGG